MSSPVLLHPRHLRQARICMAGGRDWFAQRNWSWADFVAHGRSVDDFIATRDPLAQRAVAVAIREAEDGR